jgi:beta-glucosidase
LHVSFLIVKNLLGKMVWQPIWELVAFASLVIGSPALQGRSESESYVINSTIVSDSYFYGQSPPVYPAPLASGTGEWKAAYQKAKSFVAQLTIEEKVIVFRSLDEITSKLITIQVNLTSGYSDTTNGCAGNIAAIPRLGFPGLCLQDASNGVRGTDLVNGYPSGVHVGAS